MWELNKTIKNKLIVASNYRLNKVKNLLKQRRNSLLMKKIKDESYNFQKTSDLHNNILS